MTLFLCIMSGVTFLLGIYCILYWYNVELLAIVLCFLWSHNLQYHQKGMGNNENS